MEGIIYNAPHEIALRTNIAMYFFLTGVSAASFIISSLAYVFGMKKYEPCGKLGAVLAFIVLSIAPLFLIIDLLQPLRFVHLFYMFNIKSPVTWGTILLILYPLNCLVYIFSIYTNNRPMAKFFGNIGIPLAVAVHGYTGFILALAKGIALWNTPLMPIYFLISAMVSGTALLIVLSVLKEKYFGNVEIIKKIFPTIEKEIIFDLGRMLLIFIFIDLFVAFCDVVLLFYTTPENQIAATLLLKGPFSIMFLFGEIFLGMLIPSFILIIPPLNKNINLITFASILVLIGIWFMRYVTVVSGQYVPLM
jgi:tetrathionate reductase subunit C